MLLLNARSVEAHVIDKLADAGLSVAIQPGGIPEQLRADHTQEIAVFSSRLGSRGSAAHCSGMPPG